MTWDSSVLIELSVVVKSRIDSSSLVIGEVEVFDLFFFFFNDFLFNFFFFLETVLAESVGALVKELLGTFKVIDPISFSGGIASSLNLWSNVANSASEEPWIVEVEEVVESDGCKAFSSWVEVVVSTLSSVVEVVSCTVSVSVSTFVLEAVSKIILVSVAVASGSSVTVETIGSRDSVVVSVTTSGSPVCSSSVEVISSSSSSSYSSSASSSSMKLVVIGALVSTAYKPDDKLVGPVVTLLWFKVKYSLKSNFLVFKDLFW